MTQSRMTSDISNQSSASEEERLAEVGSTQSILGWVQLFIVIGVLVGAVLFNRILSSGIDEGLKTVTSSAVPIVSVVQPKRQTLAPTVNTTGTVQPRTQINISPQVSGRVVYVSPKLVAGGEFRAGEILLRIEADDFSAAKRQAEADLDTAENALLLEQAEAETARREWALINPSESVPALVARQPQIAQAMANIKNAQARLDNAKTTLGRTQISFPFDGRVLETTVEIGQALAQNQSYGAVYRLNDLEVHTELRAPDIELIAPAVGRDVRLSQRNSTSQINSKIIRSNEQIDTDTQLGILVASLPTDTELRPGIFVNVTIIGAEKPNVYALSPALINSDASVWRVSNGVLDKVYISALGTVDGLVLLEAFDVGQGLVQSVPAGAKTGLTVEIASIDGRG